MSSRSFETHGVVTDAALAGLDIGGHLTRLGQMREVVPPHDSPSPRPLPHHRVVYPLDSSLHVPQLFIC
jgi:hypothetical protein